LISAKTNAIDLARTLRALAGGLHVFAKVSMTIKAMMRNPTQRKRKMLTFSSVYRHCPNADMKR
jgi:hypothetical protein